jgi:hypothetical protein
MSLGCGFAGLRSLRAQRFNRFTNSQGRATARLASVVNREKEKLAWDPLFIIFAAIHG